LKHITAILFLENSLRFYYQILNTNTMKKILFFVLLFTSPHLFAQKEISKFDIRLGSGLSIFGTGDIVMITMENEVNYRINKYFTTSIALNYGGNLPYEFENARYWQGAMNLYLSPFKNIRHNDFRIGTGLTTYALSDNQYGIMMNLENGEKIAYGNYVRKRDSWGYSIIAEDTYAIKNKYLIGLKFFTQPYNNGDIHTGILLKLGIKI
jgi:hypothetical protein